LGAKERKKKKSNLRSSSDDLGLEIAGLRFRHRTSADVRTLFRNGYDVKNPQDVIHGCQQSLYV
jgi:hypothetical protein